MRHFKISIFTVALQLVLAILSLKRLSNVGQVDLLSTDLS